MDGRQDLHPLMALHQYGFQFKSLLISHTAALTPNLQLVLNVGEYVRPILLLNDDCFHWPKMTWYVDIESTGNEHANLVLAMKQLL